MEVLHIGIGHGCVGCKLESIPHIGCPQIESQARTYPDLSKPQEEAMPDVTLFPDLLATKPLPVSTDSK